MLQKRRVITSSDGDLELYCQLFTPYPFKYVEHHFQLSNGLSVNSEASVSDCTCGFRRAMLLPCCHILSARSGLGLSKFEHSLCAQRWSAEYYTKGRRVLFLEECDEPEPLHVDRQEHSQILSSHQKFRKASAVVSRIAGVVSEISMPKVLERIEVLEALLHHLMRDDIVHLTVEEREVTANDSMNTNDCFISHDF